MATPLGRTSSSPRNVLHPAVPGGRRASHAADLLGVEAAVLGARGAEGVANEAGRLRCFGQALVTPAPATHVAAPALVRIHHEPPHAHSEIHVVGVVEEHLLGGIQRQRHRVEHWKGPSVRADRQEDGKASPEALHADCVGHGFHHEQGELLDGEGRLQVVSGWEPEQRIQATPGGDQQRDPHRVAARPTGSIHAELPHDRGPQRKEHHRADPCRVMLVPVQEAAPKPNCQANGNEQRHRHGKGVNAENGNKSHGSADVED
mmetsp:Transcript_149721/g.480774  ORF Transcript_149721/g.480774 Transcript_149721/m.480774 type:complete len:261 (-) Transcript_149721:43-825(-)